MIGHIGLGSITIKAITTVQATSNPTELDWTATCPKGMESLLADEIQNLGAQSVKQTVAAVNFKGDLEHAYRVCLWSRIANRVLLSLHKFELKSADDLYHQCHEIAWEEHLNHEHSIDVDFVGSSRHIDNSMYGAQRVKDAMVDRLRTITGERPSVDAKNPDIRVPVSYTHLTLPTNREV